MMIGPILYQEWLLGGRRNRLHMFRWIYAGWLVLLVLWYFLQFLSEEAMLAQMRLWSGGGPDRQVSAVEVVGARFANFFIWQQALLTFLAVPIFTCGAIVDEKRNGTLQYLMLSEMKTWHLLLGKLIGRLGQTTLWLMAGWPIFALLAGFGGVDPRTMLLLLAGLLAPMFGVAAISLLASVWCRQTREAVLAVYMLLVVGWLAIRIFGGPFRILDPLWVLEPTWNEFGLRDLSLALQRLGLAWAGYGVLGLTAFVVAAVTLDRAYQRELADVRRERLRWYSVDREPITDTPIRWREQHVEGLALNATLRRIPHWLSILAVALLTSVSSLLILRNAMAPGAAWEDLLSAMMHLNLRKMTMLLPTASQGFMLQGIVVMLLASLIVGVRCAGAITQERERHTWEAVLLTPISAGQIVQGKLWGVVGASTWYLLAYAAPALTLSALAGPMALLYTLAWLPATVLAMYFIGAAGLWCSARSTSSWRALLQTMGFGYVGGLMMFALSSPAIFAVLIVLILLLYFADLYMGTTFAKLCLSNITYTYRVFFFASAASLVVLFWLLARFFNNGTQRWIADRERTRFQFPDPLYNARGPGQLKVK